VINGNGKNDAEEDLEAICFVGRRGTMFRDIAFLRTGSLGFRQDAAAKCVQKKKYGDCIRAKG
jgi:hypothetical protein